MKLSIIKQQFNGCLIASDLVSPQGRTVMTSVTTALVLLVLFVVGGKLIHGFSIALLFGVIVGTYSSIYIASASALALGVSKADLMPVQKEGADQPAQD